jgi:hypothetical protein
MNSGSSGLKYRHSWLERPKRSNEAVNCSSVLLGAPNAGVLSRVLCSQEGDFGRVICGFCSRSKKGTETVSWVAINQPDFGSSLGFRRPFGGTGAWTGGIVEHLPPPGEEAALGNVFFPSDGRQRPMPPKLSPTSHHPLCSGFRRGNFCTVIRNSSWRG